MANIDCALETETRSQKKAYPVLVNPDEISSLSLDRFAAICLANNHLYNPGKFSANKTITFLSSAFLDVQLYGLNEMPFASIPVTGKKCAVIGCVEFCFSMGPRLFREEDAVHLIRDLRGEAERLDAELKRSGVTRDSQSS